MKAAIVHFTDQSNIRPIYYQKQLKALEDFASSKGFNGVDVFCDKSLHRCERPEYDRFLKHADEYDALFCKDFYHLSKNTMKCVSTIKELRDQHGVVVYTMENGYYIDEEEPLSKTLKVATYHTHYPNDNEYELDMDILRLFARKKTNWEVVDQYSDIIRKKNDYEQVQLQELLKNKEKFDLVLVHNMQNLHWRTANFFRIRESLAMDIYSLQTGYLKYTH